MYERYDLKTLLEEIAEDAAKTKSATAPNVTQDDIRGLFEEHRKSQYAKPDEKS